MGTSAAIDLLHPFHELMFARIVASLAGLPFRSLPALVHAPLLVISLSACDPFAAPDSMLDEYVKRVGRVLEVELRLSPVPIAPELPRRRDRLRPIPELNVRMLDFLGLYGCELQHVIGERNSSLGRVMHPGSRLEYELRFIRAADDCIAELARESLIERMEEVVTFKRATLSDVAWNAVWGGREVEHLFTRSRGRLAIGVDRNALAEMASELRAMETAVRRITAGELEVDVKGLDSVYREWLRQPLMGQLIASAILVTTRLDDAATMIEMRLGSAPLCQKRMRNRRADIMLSMFRSVYAEHVQPYLADVQRARRDLLPPLQALAEIPGGGTEPVFHAYLQLVIADGSEGGWWAAFDNAVQRHTRAWQDLLDQCGMLPGRAAAPAAPRAAGHPEIGQSRPRTG
jgi:hypothetical protein